MMSTEPNGTLTALANSTESPYTRCINLEDYEWLFTYETQYMWFIFVLGLIENLFVISVFVFHKSRCTVTELYLLNMAAVDLIFVIRIPFRGIDITEYYRSFGNVICVAFAFLFPFNLYSSICFLMMVSIDRYLALVKPMSIGRLRRPGWAKVICVIIWIFAALLNVHQGLDTRVAISTEYNTSVSVCVSSLQPLYWFIATNTLTNVLGFLVPLVVTSFCTYHMIRVLRNNAMRQFKKINKERRATWLVLLVFLLFIVCWLPYNIAAFIQTLNVLDVFLPCTVTAANFIFYHISYYIALSNSCINPVIYSMVGNRFRQKTREVYSRFKCKGPDRIRSSLPTGESASST